MTEIAKIKTPCNIKWTERQDNALKKLKNAICEAPDCIVPNVQISFNIFTDASNFTVETYLAQINEDEFE